MLLHNLVPSDDRDVPLKQLNEVLESMELGYTHYRLLIMCGLSFMADAMVRFYCLLL